MPDDLIDVALQGDRLILDGAIHALTEADRARRLLRRTHPAATTAAMRAHVEQAEAHASDALGSMKVRSAVTVLDGGVLKLTAAQAIDRARADHDQATIVLQRARDALDARIHDREDAAA